MIVAGAAAFLDRDGTIIEDRDYLADPQGVQLLPGAAAAIRRLNRAGVAVIVVTNQSGIGRGYFTEAQYEAVHSRFLEVLEREGAEVAATYHCPHGPDEDPPCRCRKPRPGMFERAAREHGLVLPESFFAGDKLRDLAPGLEAGGSSYLIRAGPTAQNENIPKNVRVVESLEQAVDHWLNQVYTD